MVDVRVLGRLKVFAGLNQEQRECIAAHLEEEIFEPNQSMVHQGELGDCMYVLVRGEAGVFLSRGRPKTTVAKLEAGDFFGEIAMLSGCLRTASVEATTKCKVLRISRDMFAALLQQRPDICAQFLRTVVLVLSSRVQTMNKRFSDSLLLAAVGRA